MICNSLCKAPRIKSKRQGFTLLETAIVLLAASFVIGGIWVAAQHVMDNARITRATQEVTKIVQNIREYYMNTTKFPAVQDMTGTMDNLNLFPLEMRRNGGAAGGPIDHPMDNTQGGGSFHVLAVTCVGGDGLPDCFRVIMQRLSTDSCVKMLMALPVSDADMGVVQVGTYNMGYGTTNFTTSLTASTVKAWCNQGAVNEVDFDFKLRH